MQDGICVKQKQVRDGGEPGDCQGAEKPVPRSQSYRGFPYNSFRQKKD